MTAVRDVPVQAVLLSPRVSAKAAGEAAVGVAACSAQAGRTVPVPLCAVGCCDSHRSDGKSLCIWAKGLSLCSWMQSLCSWMQVRASTWLPPRNASNSVWHPHEGNPVFPRGNCSPMLRLTATATVALVHTQDGISFQPLAGNRSGYFSKCVSKFFNRFSTALRKTKRVRRG